MSFSPHEAVEPISLDFEKDELEPLSSEAKIIRIKKDLHNIIKDMRQKNSVFSKMAEFWGTKPWWLKLILASVIIIPILVVAALFQLYTLIAFGIFLAIIYTCFSLLMDNHQAKEQESLQKLEDSISALAELLENIINELERISRLLASQVEKFTQENIKLMQTTYEFSEKNASLEKHVQATAEINWNLEQTIIDLKDNEQQLHKVLISYKELLTQCEKQMQNNQNKYTKNLENLENQIMHLQKNNNELDKNLKTAKMNNQILLNSVKKFSDLKEKVAKSQEEISKDFEHKNEKTCIAIDGLQSAAIGMNSTATLFKKTIAESCLLIEQGSHLRSNKKINEDLEKSNSENSNAFW